MISFLYSGDYSVELSPNADSDATPLLILHAHLYAMGDKFGIARLKFLAISKTAHELELRRESWMDVILPSAGVVWSSTPPSDRDLRNEYIKHFLVARTDRMHDDESVRRARLDDLAIMPEFAHDLLTAELSIQIGANMYMDSCLRLSCFDCGSAKVFACHICGSEQVKVDCPLERWTRRRSPYNSSLEDARI